MGAEIILTALEYRLLLVLPIISDRSSAGVRFWADLGCSGGFVNDNTLTVYIKRLRGKLEDDPKIPSL